jgi:hypothetical protein
MATHRRLAESGPDFYPTPRWGTLALLDHEKFQGSILEPCCGDGSMVNVLREGGYWVEASDKYDRNFGERRDFFDITALQDNIVTNPPFGIAEDILDHALSLASSKVCLLLRTAFLESQRRYRKFFRDRPPARVLVFTQRLSIYKNGDQGDSAGGTTSYSWFIWEIGNYQETRIVWVPPVKA